MRKCKLNLIQRMFYKIKYSIIDYRYNIEHFFRNTWKFRKELATHRDYDFHYSLMLLSKSLKTQLFGIETKSYEVDEDRLPKIERLKRCIFLLDRIIEDDYNTIVGVDYNYEIEFVPTDETKKYYTLVDNRTEEQKKYNDEKYVEARELEKSEYDEFFTILKEDLKGWWW